MKQSHISDWERDVRSPSESQMKELLDFLIDPSTCLELYIGKPDPRLAIRALPWFDHADPATRDEIGDLLDASPVSTMHGLMDFRLLETRKRSLSNLVEAVLDVDAMSPREWMALLTRCSYPRTHKPLSVVAQLGRRLDTMWALPSFSVRHKKFSDDLKIHGIDLSYYVGLGGITKIFAGGSLYLDDSNHRALATFCKSVNLERPIHALDSSREVEPVSFLMGVEAVLSLLPEFSNSKNLKAVHSALEEAKQDAIDGYNQDATLSAVSNTVLDLIAELTSPNHLPKPLTNGRSPLQEFKRLMEALESQDLDDGQENNEQKD